MTKRILYIVNALLLIAVIVVGSMVFGKVNEVVQALRGPGVTDPIDTSAVTQPTDTMPSDPTDPSDSKPTDAVTVPSAPPTQPSQPQDPSGTVHVHAYVKTETKEATCTGYGYDIMTCFCGASKTDNLVEPIGHDYKVGTVVKPTCEEEGYTPLICIRCNDEQRRSKVDPTGHKYVVESVVSPTCTQRGYSVMRCANKDCDETKKDKYVAALGHRFGEWVTVLEPTTETLGQKERQCTFEGCTEKETGEIPMLEKPKITNTLISSPPLTDADGNRFIRYIVEVGTSDNRRQFTYTIDDYIMNVAPVFTYDENGLTVKYTDQNGIVQSIPLAPAEDNEIAIGKPQPQPSEPTDPSVTPSDPTTTPSEPSTTPTDPSVPTIPTDPSEPTTPTDPSEPTTPTDPSTDPTDPTTPVNPT